VTLIVASCMLLGMACAGDMLARARASIESRRRRRPRYRLPPPPRSACLEVALGSVCRRDAGSFVRSPAP
jgi:hypothetical protein